jgi:hypothetical protein
MAGLGYNNSNDTFILVSIETAYIAQAKVSSVGYTAPATWDAGQIGYFNGSGEMICVDGSATSASKFRVLTMTKTSDVDETLPTGTVGYVQGPHIGRTKKFDSTITSATVPGTSLYVKSTGEFCASGQISSCPVVATAQWCDGTWLQYEWVLANQ